MSHQRIIGDIKITTEIRPKFNVVEAFQGVITVQMNQEMADMLSMMISEVHDVELEIVAFGKGLQDPGKGRELRNNKFKHGANGHR